MAREKKSLYIRFMRFVDKLEPSFRDTSVYSRPDFQSPFLNIIDFDLMPYQKDSYYQPPTNALKAKYRQLNRLNNIITTDVLENVPVSFAFKFAFFILIYLITKTPFYLYHYPLRMVRTLPMLIAMLMSIMTTAILSPVLLLNLGLGSMIATCTHRILNNPDKNNSSAKTARFILTAFLLLTDIPLWSFYKITHFVILGTLALTHIIDNFVSSLLWGLPEIFLNVFYPGKHFMSEPDLVEGIQKQKVGVAKEIGAISETYIDPVLTAFFSTKVISNTGAVTYRMRTPWGDPKNTGKTSEIFFELPHLAFRNAERDLSSLIAPTRHVRLEDAQVITAPVLTPATPAATFSTGGAEAGTATAAAAPTKSCLREHPATITFGSKTRIRIT